MMFIMHIAEMLGLIAMALGVMLVFNASQNLGNGSTLAKIFGWLIIILSIGSVACTSYCAYQFWRSGYFQSFQRMQMMHMKNENPMMDEMGMVAPVDKQNAKNNVKKAMNH